MIPSNTQVILFDVYGTLLDGPRHPDRHECMTSVTRRFGLPDHPSLDATLDAAIAADHRESTDCWPEIDIRQIWQSIFPTLRDADAFALELEEAIHPVSPTSWAIDHLDAAVASGARLGIVSNAQAYTRQLLARHFPDHWALFRPELCAFSYEHRISKPDLRLFQHAVDPLVASGLPPGQILMIGDSVENDQQPATELGLTFRAVP